MIAINANAKSFSLYVGQTSYIPYPSPKSSSWAVNTSSVSYGSSSTNVSINKDGSFKVEKYFSGSVTVFSQYTCTYYQNGVLHVTPLQYDYHTVTCLSNDITLSCSKSSINVENTATLSYKFAHSTFDATPSVKYTASPSNCVSISGNTVTGIKSGTVTITATSNLGDNQSSITLTVKDVTPTGVSLPASLTVNEGASSTLSATLTPSNASTTFNWWSEEKGIATVSSSSSSTVTVNGVAPGKTKIYVKTANGYKDYCDVTVRSTEPTGITLAESVRLKYGATKTLEAIMTPSYAKSDITWKSENEDIATVSATGVVTAVGEGNTNITATTVRGGYTAKCNVTVAAKPTHFVICLNDEKRVAYALEDNPKVVNGDGIITIIDKDITIEYPLENVHKYVLGVGTDYESASKIAKVEVSNEREIKQSSGSLIFSGFKAGERVNIYNVNGTLASSFKIGPDDNLEISLSQYSMGVYIVKTQSQTFKFIKR